MIISWLTETILQWLACLIVVLPLVGLAIWQECKKGNSVQMRTLALLVVFFFVALSLARSSNAFNWLPSPWQGMALEAIFALIVILGTRSARASGLSSKISRSAWQDVIFATLLLLMFVIIRSVLLQITGISKSNNNFGLEFLLFQLTVPGITEELVYRGVIQSRLNDIFSKTWRLWNANIGWGLVITAILFWAIHAFQISDWDMSFRWQTLTLPLVVGVGLGWMRERSKSLLPSIIAHNLVNFLVTIL
jgi:uncharacterized protein